MRSAGRFSRASSRRYGRAAPARPRTAGPASPSRPRRQNLARAPPLRARPARLPPLRRLSRRDVRGALHERLLRLPDRLRPARGLRASERDRRVRRARRDRVRLALAGAAHRRRDLRPELVRACPARADGRRRDRPAAAARRAARGARGGRRPGRLPAAVARRAAVPRSARSSSRSRFRTTPPAGCSSRVSVALAVLVSFGIRFLVNLASFWLLDYRGPVLLAVAVNLVLSGMVIPLAFFPGRSTRSPALRRSRRCCRRRSTSTSAPRSAAARRRCSRCRRRGRSRSTPPVGSCSLRARGSWWCRVAELRALAGIYRRLVGARIRAQLEYRLSAVLQLLGTGRSPRSTSSRSRSSSPTSRARGAGRWPRSRSSTRSRRSRSRSRTSRSATSTSSRR